MARLLAGLLSLACLPSLAPASDQVVDLQHHDELLDALREYDVVALRYWMNHCPYSKYSEPEVRALRSAAPLPPDYLKHERPCVAVPHGGGPAKGARGHSLHGRGLHRDGQ